MEDISFDLETFGTKTNSHIVSIAAVKFDLTSDEIGEQFIRKINIKKEQKGRVIDPGTIVWWLQQSDEARTALLPNGEKVYELFEALRELYRWLINDTTAYKVWGNGATFDISLLESAFETIGQADKIPWKFWDIRDLRTIIDVAGRIKGFDKRNMMREGTHHSAMDDAIHQAKLAQQAYKALNS